MRHRSFIFLLAAVLLCAASVSAQLAVVVSPPKVVGQKAVVQLKMKNELADKVESARAVCFLLDDQGKMIGQSTKWVIGQNKIGLDPKGQVKFNFVITNPRSLMSSNLKALLTDRELNFASANLHHTTPIESGGGVYDLDNLLITSPRYHAGLHGN